MSNDKWFSIDGIQKETKRVRWPKWGDIGSNTSTVIVFTAFFALYFTLCEFVVTWFLKMIGIGA